MGLSELKERAQTAYKSLISPAIARLHLAQEHWKRQFAYLGARDSVAALLEYDLENKDGPTPIAKLGYEHFYLHLAAINVWPLLPQGVQVIQLLNGDNLRAFRHPSDLDYPHQVVEREHIWDLATVDRQLWVKAKEEGYRYKPVFPIDYMG